MTDRRQGADLQVVQGESLGRLFEAGAARREPVEPLGLPEGETPLALMRVGPKDLPHALTAVAEGASPSALVSGISEPPDFTSRIHRECKRRGLSWIVDPLFFETALDGYKTKLHLQGLGYTPRRGQRYTARSLRSTNRRRSLARQVVRAQLELGSGAFETGALLSAGLDDPLLDITRELISTGIAARDASAQIPILAQLPIRMLGFDDLESQRLLVRSFGRRRPDAYLLMLDGVDEDSRPERLAAAIRLALLLRATGVRVVVARPGDLRRLFLAFGIDGIEFGLGRLLRFAKPDYERQGGQGPTPGPRFECPLLAASLPSAQAKRALDLDVLPECSCPSCTTAEDPDQRLEHGPQHDAHIVDEQLGHLSGVAPGARVDALYRDLRTATHEWVGLERRGIAIGGRRRIEQWLQAVDLVAEWGYLEPGRAEEVLDLP